MTPRRARLAAVLLVALPRLAHAHAGRVPEPHDLWRAWTVAPFVVIALMISAGCYAAGVRAVWQHAGVGRGASRIQVGSFIGSLLAIAIALLSPIDAVSEALFSVHMVQHLLLVLLAAPLIVLGVPEYVTMWALPTASRRGLVRWWRGARPLIAFWTLLRHPVVAWVLHVGALWAWHFPRLYDAALRDSGVHILEHTTFLLTAMVFWWVVFRGNLSLGASTLYLFAAALQGTLLGALITIARHPWYVGHYATTQPWGVTPLEDQQIAGLIMWIPAGLVYLLAMLPRWMRTLTQRARTPGVVFESPTTAR